LYALGRQHSGRIQHIEASRVSGHISKSDQNFLRQFSMVIFFLALVALALIFLACSGLWLWTVRWIKSRQHQRSG